jgi:hypothetical protein
MTRIDPRLTLVNVHATTWAPAIVTLTVVSPGVNDGVGFAPSPPV